MSDRQSKIIPQRNLVETLDEYINLPRIVKATQITPELAKDYMDGKILFPHNVRVHQCARIGDQIKEFVVEFTMIAEQGGHGKLYASFNDWIVLGTADEWYPINDQVFKYKYARHQLMNASEAPYNG